MDLMRNFLCLGLLFSNLAFASTQTPHSCAASLLHHQKLDANFLSRHFLSTNSYPEAYRAVYIDQQDRVEKWMRKIPAQPGVAFRGMKVSADELNAIFRDGMLVSKAAAYFGGALWAAAEIEVPVGFILPALGNLAQKPLAVLFEIDLTGLHVEIVETIDSKPFYKIRQDVPPSSIRRIFIYDPSQDPEDFPFTIVPGNGG